MKARMVWMSVLLGGLSATALIAAQDDVTWSVAEAAATANAGTPAGKEYEAKIAPAFGRYHADTVGQCAKATKRPELTDFKLLVRVDAGGTVGKVLVDPKTNVSGCVQDKLLGWKVPEPPQAGFWVKVAVNLKKK